MYCIEVWGKARDKFLNPLKKLQRKVVRIINNSSYMSDTEPIFKALQIFNVEQIYSYKTLLFVYKYHNGMYNDILPNFFTHNCVIHSYNTRFNKNLHTPLVLKDTYHRSVKITGIKLWNKLINRVDCNVTFNVFKKQLKKYILD